MNLIDVLQFMATGLVTLSSEAGKSAGFWMPGQGSTVAPMVDEVFWFVLVVSTVFFVGIIAVMFAFMVMYRRRHPGQRAQSHRDHNDFIETAWTVIPLLIAIYMFWVGFEGYIDMRTPPGNSYRVNVTAQAWSWQFDYPTGAFSDTLHVPVDTPVELTMSSMDYLHAFFVPEFRVKMDIVPGKYTKLWFNATEPGEYNVFCTEYCGTGHSDMITKVVVHEPGGFEPWLQKASNPYPEEDAPHVNGEKAYRIRGCTQCHSIDGSTGIGPTFKGIYGKQESFTDGTTLTVDENYIRESIVDPQAKILEGFEGVMPTYQGRLSDAEITFIIAFIKSLADEGA